MNFRKLLLMAATASLCIPSNSWSQSKTPATKTKQTAKRKLLDPANMDLSVNPGDNFFFYANGTWLKNNQIPATETRWGSFNELQENNYKALHELLESAAKANAKKGSNLQKIGDFYKSGMDTNTIEKAGIAPLNSHFMRIARIQNADELLKEICYEHTIGLSPVLDFTFHQTIKMLLNKFVNLDKLD
jgi:putative endopeptidase